MPFICFTHGSYIKNYKQTEKKKKQTRTPLVISVGTPSLKLVSYGALAEQIQLISCLSKPVDKCQM